MHKIIINVKKYRQLANLTQKDLAEQVGVRRETIGRLENGMYNPSLILALQIADVLETPIDNLFSLDLK